MKFIKISISLFVLILTLSCAKLHKYEEYKTLDANGWNKDSLAVFKVDFEGNNKNYDLNIDIRNKQNYAYSNLWLFINIESPAGIQTADTLECTIADPTGRWLGSGLGDLFDNEYKYKQNVTFPDSGTYKITLQHGMRANNLEGISDIGISIKKTEE